MRIHPSVTILALPALALGLAACGSSTSQSPAANVPAAPAPQQASLVIHHANVGCHDWALNGGVDLYSRESPVFILKRHFDDHFDFACMLFA